MINLNQLRAFYQVAKSLNFSIAAETLCVTQPAVTKHVKTLEEDHNLKLFLKRRGKICLTDEGKKIFAYASRIFDLEGQLEETITGLQNLKQGSLRIGTPWTYAKNYMTTLFMPFQKAHPDIIIELDVGSSSGMMKSLLDFRNSLSIAARIEDHPDILFTPLLLEEVVLIAAPDHPLARRKNIRFREIEGLPIVMKETGSGVRKLLEDVTSNEKITLNVIAQTGNMEFMEQLVRQKKAISFVVKSSVEQKISEGELISIPIKDQRLLLDVYIAHLREYELPYSAKAFLEYLIPDHMTKELPIGMGALVKRIVDSHILV